MKGHIPCVNNLCVHHEVTLCFELQI